MNKRRLAIGRRNVILLSATLCACSTFAPAQEPAQPRAPATTATRPCSANPVLTYSSKKKNARKPKHPLPPEPAPTCVEVKGDPLGIQEFLQNLARERSWRVGENHASEDTWSFVRYFNPDELDTYADTKVLIEPVKFTTGKAAAMVRTTDIGGEFVRVQISVHFQGEGKSTDPTWTQPATVWPLNSKGVFEQELVTALQTRYKPLD
jgi:hypothetical protein